MNTRHGLPFLVRRLGWFAAIWAASVAALFVVATLIRLAVGH